MIVISFFCPSSHELINCIDVHSCFSLFNCIS